MSSELAQAVAWLIAQAGETHETVKSLQLLDRGERIAIEVNGRVVGEVDKVLLMAEPEAQPGVN
jgi:hypothetical protein